MPSQDLLKQRIQQGEVIIGVSAPITADRKRLEDILHQDKIGRASCRERV